MTRTPVRILWGLIGACLIAGAAASLLALIGPKPGPWVRKLIDFAPLIDVVAVVLWMLVFAFYWSRHPED